MSRPTIWEPEAEDELYVATYVSQAEFDQADELHARIADVLDKIHDNHDIGRPDPDSPADLDIRRFSLQPFPYAVIYLIAAGEPVVIALAHGSREQGFWLPRIERFR